MHFEGVFAVFELVGLGDGVEGEFAFFAHEGEGFVEGVGEGAAEDEAAGVGADDDVDILGGVAFFPEIDDVAECVFVLE